MRIFKNAWFGRFARKEGIADALLCEAVERAGRGLIDADLGGGLIKQRIARRGSGRSGGYRTLIVFKASSRAVFIFGFAKNAMQNIDANDLASFRTAAGISLAFSGEDVDRLVEMGTFIEVFCNGDERDQKSLSQRSGCGDP